MVRGNKNFPLFYPPSLINVKKILFMTFEEAAEEYKKVFILYMETAGEKEDIDSYRNVEKIIENAEKTKPKLISELLEIEDFGLYISTLILFILDDMYTVKALSQMDPSRLNELYHAIWDIHLAQPTKKFMKRNGLPPIEDLNERIIRIIERKKIEGGE